MRRFLLEVLAEMLAHALFAGLAYALYALFFKQKYLATGIFFTLIAAALYLPLIWLRNSKD